jgi:hypothetical protein
MSGPPLLLGLRPKNFPSFCIIAKVPRNLGGVTG